MKYFLSVKTNNQVLTAGIVTLTNEQVQILQDFYQNTNAFLLLIQQP